jgi:glutamate-1-semialdehyde aminotransferase
MKILAIVQARLGSNRLPSKVLKKIGDRRVIEILLDRLSLSKKIDQIVIAIPNKNNSKLKKFLEKKKFEVFEGSEKNVLERYYRAAKKFNGKIIVRITADCPLIDSTLVDRTIDILQKKGGSYASNCYPRTFPDGLDVEVFTLKTLQKAFKKSKTDYEKEHVTPSIKKDKNIKKIAIKSKNQLLSQIRLTLDTKEDLIIIRKIFKKFYPDIFFSWKKTIQYYMKIKKMNFKKKKSSNHSKGQKLWVKANKLIPNGNMLLSKNPNRFLPKVWPTYFSKAKGCQVWDLDKKKYTDMSTMGVGTNILGFQNSNIDNVVKNTIFKSNMSTLNCPEEVYLAEKLIEMHKWSDMVKFTRTGGEANALAVRIARAASGKDTIAFCGYHGWHDWYLATNLKSEKNLNSHLIKDLKIKGVPKKLSGSIIPFKYNDFNYLKRLVEKNNIGVIKMEVVRDILPKNNFLKKVRNLASKKGIVLIFDECTTGFRESFGGIHKIYGVEPDISIFGKALGNGYAICAVVGKREVMEHAKESFISSTFWSERIGPTAALQTLSEMNKIKSWKIISQIGKKIKKNWLKISKENKVPIDILGIDALPKFSIVSKNNLAYKTLITQEMLKKGFLASNAIYVSTAHKEKYLSHYFDILNDIFKKIKKCEEGEFLSDYLETPLSKKDFGRLN